MRSIGRPEANVEADNRLKKQICDIGLPSDLTDDIVGHYTLLDYKKGATIAVPGSPADVLFYIMSGLVKVYCPCVDGSRILIMLAGLGDFIGYVDDLDSRGHRVQIFEIEALTKTSVALFTREHILKALKSLDRGALLNLIEKLNTAWSSAVLRLGRLLGMSFNQRLELVLKELTAKFGVRDSRGVLLMPELSHSDFADMIGSSRPMVTRFMAKMAKEGLLLRQGKHFILCDHVANEQSRVRETEKPSSQSVVDGTFKAFPPLDQRRQRPASPVAKDRVRRNRGGKLLKLVTDDVPALKTKVRLRGGVVKAGGHRADPPSRLS
jgi:CRP-like cAMP-binding protein